MRHRSMFLPALTLMLGIHVAANITRGVNLGGWLVVESWMTPSLFESTSAGDEWTLCNELGKKKCRETLEDHWSTFYSRNDLQQIKAAGLDAVRIPIGYWAVDLLDYEPYVSGQFPYLIRAVEWARDLGLKVMIDLHGAPGSQNGWSLSGLVGPVLFGTNQTTIDRAINVLRNLTDEFSRSVYGGAVTNIELLNEPTLDMAPLKSFYTLAAPVVNVTGINVTIHDGFFQPHSWADYDPSNPLADRPAPDMTLDTHQFWTFPPLDTLGEDEILERICQYSTDLRKNNSGIPPTLVAEWSLSSGVTANSTNGDIAANQTKRTWFRRMFEAQNAAFTPNGPNQSSIGWYFWTWKLEYDIDAWSYRKGVANGYIPANVSDPSTYVYPILANGCIDPTFNWTAPARVISNSDGSNGGSLSGDQSGAAEFPITRSFQVWVGTILSAFLGALS